MPRHATEFAAMRRYAMRSPIVRAVPIGSTYFRLLGAGMAVGLTVNK